MTRSFLAWVLALAAAGCSDPTGTSRDAIIGGTPSDASQDFVVVIANYSGNIECNADLIAPNLLVTARHCVGVLDPTHPLACTVGSATRSSPTVMGDYPPSDFVVYKDELLTQPVTGGNNLAVHVTQVIDAGASTLCGEDIAFVVLDQPPASLPVATLSTTLPAPGDLVTVVGSGEIDTDGDFPVQRLQRTGVQVLALGPTTVPLSDAGSARYAVPAGEFASTVSFCHGDSGGPAIDASGNITGIVSATPSCMTGPDDFTSIAAHLDLATQAYATVGITFPVVDAGATDASADSSPMDSGTAPMTNSGGCAMGATTSSPLSGTFILGLTAALHRRRKPKRSGSSTR